MDQRAGLVQHAGGKADPELDRRQRQAPSLARVAGVVRGDLRPPAAIVTVVGQHLNHGAQHALGHVHLVWGQRAALAVQIVQPHVQRIATHLGGDLVQHTLGHDHALGPTEPAKGRVRQGIGFISPTADQRAWQEVGVLTVESCPVVNGPCEVLAKAATAGQHKVRACDQALVVKADLNLGQEVVPLAGRDHIVVAVQA